MFSIETTEPHVSRRTRASKLQLQSWLKLFRGEYFWYFLFLKDVNLNIQIHFRPFKMQTEPICSQAPLLYGVACFRPRRASLQNQNTPEYSWQARKFLLFYCILSVVRGLLKICHTLAQLQGIALSGQLPDYEVFYKKLGRFSVKMTINDTVIIFLICFPFSSRFQRVFCSYFIGKYYTKDIK